MFVIRVSKISLKSFESSLLFPLQLIIYCLKYSLKQLLNRLLVQLLKWLLYSFLALLCSFFVYLYKWQFFLADVAMSFRSVVIIGLFVCLIKAKILVVLVVILVVLVMVLALILVVVAAVCKKGSIYFLTGVFLLLCNN